MEKKRGNQVKKIESERGAPEGRKRGRTPSRRNGKNRGSSPKRRKQGPRLENGKRWLALWWNTGEARTNQGKREEKRQGRKSREWMPRVWYKRREEGNLGAKRSRVRCRVSSTPNNTKVVRSWFDEKKGRRVNRVKTAGGRGYKNTKRGSTLAAQEVRADAGKAYLEKREKAGESRGKGPRRHRTRRGMGRGRIQAMNELEKRGFQIATVSDMTKNPHNGCRRKKARRI